MGRRGGNAGRGGVCGVIGNGADAILGRVKGHLPGTADKRIKTANTNKIKYAIVNPGGDRISRPKNKCTYICRWEAG